MKHNVELQERISAILAAWNPIGVPNFIADDEYRDYIEPILSIGNDPVLLEKHLVVMVVETLGLSYDDENPNHHEELRRVVEDLVKAFSV